MPHLPLQPLQAALLFENASQFDSEFPEWHEVLDSLNSTGRGRPMTLVPERTDDTIAIFSNGKMHVTVERIDFALDPEGFEPLLSRPYYARMKPELVEAVEAHQRAILFEVGVGEVPPLDAPADYQPTGLRQTQEMFEQRLLLTQAATLACCRRFAPTAVHWGQSDQLFTGVEYQELAENGFSLPLYVQPGFHMSGAKQGESYLCGVDAYGAEHLIGVHVDFAEHPQAMAKSYEQVLAFIAYCRSLGRLLRDGETFSIGEDGDVIEVRHLDPTDDHPLGTIQLVIQEPEAEAPTPDQVKVRSSAVGVADALRGRRNALSGKDTPDRQAVLTEKTGTLRRLLGSLVTKAVAVAVLYLIVTGGTHLAQIGSAGDLVAALNGQTSPMPEVTRVANLGTADERPVQNNLNNAHRVAPVLHLPAMPQDL